MIGVQRVRAGATLLVALAWLGTGAAQTAAAQHAAVRALSSNGVRAALDELVPQCERTVGRELAIEFGTSASIRQRIAGGEAVDVAFLTSEVVDDLAAGGHVAAASITPLGRAGIGIGIRAGARRYDIGTAGALKQALLTARSVSYAQDGASRVHIERMFERLGIAAEMQAKTLLEQGSVRAAAKVVAGEAELLLTLVSEILPVEGMELVGALPSDFQSYINFAAALGTHAADAGAALDFVACIASPSATPAFAAKGIDR
jgi:molybdate transport system substrate-binding protein